MNDAFCRLAVEMALVDWFLFLLPPLPVAIHQVELLGKSYFAEIYLSIHIAHLILLPLMTEKSLDYFLLMVSSSVV